MATRARDAPRILSRANVWCARTPRDMTPASETLAGRWEVRVKWCDMRVCICERWESGTAVHHHYCSSDPLFSHPSCFPHYCLFKCCSMFIEPVGTIVIQVQ